MPRSQGTSRKGKPKKGERASGMGRALERSQQKRFRPKSNGSSRGAGMAMAEGTTSIGINANDAENKKMTSVLEVDDLDDFIAQAEMSQREFASERERFVVLDSVGTQYKPVGADDYDDEYDTGVKWADEENEKKQKREEERRKRDEFQFRELSVPRRPKWDEGTTPQQLHRMEEESFLDWRRAIALREEDIAQYYHKQKQQHPHQSRQSHSVTTTVTPFEKNLQVWRQLWRVLERSQIVLQIVDARNPLFYLSSDLRTYAEAELGKPMLVVVNKSDYLTAKQRLMWNKYLEERGIQHVFFSAYLEQKKLDEEAQMLRNGEDGDDSLDGQDNTELEDGNDTGENDDDNEEEEKENIQEEKQNDEQQKQKYTETNQIGIINPLTREQLLIFMKEYAKSHNIQPDERFSNRIQYGMVGFPNVGKSSVINVLVGASKHTHNLVRVGVASQPGKTKHFQTILLPDRDDVMLCDCPGLVFPSFVSSSADLVAAGVYPIAQMRDHWPVMELICRRIPREVLNAHYGITLPQPSLQDLKERGATIGNTTTAAWEDSGTSSTTGTLATLSNGGVRLPPPTAEELLGTYCIARSLLAPSSGVPDYQRASRVIIRDYVEGKLIYCHAPPSNLSTDGDGVPSSSSPSSSMMMTTRDEEEFYKETLFTAFAKTKKLRDKFLTLNTTNDDDDDDNEPSNETKSGGLAEDFDDLALEDDIDILDAVGGFAMEGDGASGTSKGKVGGNRGKKHKSMQKWGKKGRKTRNKDPYGCHTDAPSSQLYGAGGGSGSGLCVNAGKYGSKSYTRPNYAGAKAAVAFQGSGGDGIKD